MAANTVTIPVSSNPVANVRDDLLVSAAMHNAATSHAFVGVLTEAVTVAQFTDGGSTVGTYVFAGVIPAGALVLGAKVTVVGGFAGDTTATLQIGDGTTVARYNTSTVNVFATAASGIDSGVPSGLRLQLADAHPKLTITSGTDFTLVVTDGHGSLVVSLFYLPT